MTYPSLERSVDRRTSRERGVGGRRGAPHAGSHGDPSGEKRPCWVPRLPNRAAGAHIWGEMHPRGAPGLAAAPPSRSDVQTSSANCPATAGTTRRGSGSTSGKPASRTPSSRTGRGGA